MKNTTVKFVKQSLLLGAIVAAAFSAHAQRGERGGGQQPRGGSFSQPQHSQERSFSQPSGIDRSRSMPSQRSFNNTDRQPGGSFSRPAERQPSVQQPRLSQQQRTHSNQSVTRSSGNTPDQRDRVNQPGNGRNYDYNANRNVTANNSNNRYYGSNRGGYYSQQGRHYYPAPYRYTYNYPHYGQRYNTLNFSYHVIPFGGIGYCYNAGIFYRPFGNYYQVIAPPIGIGISMLPFGYSSFYLGSIPYYYYGNTFYRQYNNAYQVVDPPLGAKLPALPPGAEEVYINGQRYFEDNGTYYMEEYNINNQRLYTVVGVHGQLDTDIVDRIVNGTAGASGNVNGGGDIYSELPDNSRKVTINGTEYYRSPDDVYFQKITDGNTTSYQVVSK